MSDTYYEQLKASVEEHRQHHEMREVESEMLPREMKFGRYGQVMPLRKPLSSGPIGAFLAEHFRHFNAATVHAAAEAYQLHLRNNGEMFLTIAGAMSTAELGRSLAEMIRQKKVHAICCTGANLEEDLFNLVARDQYHRLPQYHDLTPAQDKKLQEQSINRVADTGIPEQAAMTPIEEAIRKRWDALMRKGDRAFPHEIVVDIVRSGNLAGQYQGDPAHSWLIAAEEMNLPMFVPGWEDSTLGNVFVAGCKKGRYDPLIMKTGTEYMMALVDWYMAHSTEHDLGFFQIGGGIAGDFAICVVPTIDQDMHKTGTKKWRYFCQITDADESYGGYSGALPNEKITWGKLDPDTPRFNIKSDATIVFPLIAAYVLGW